MKIHKNLVYLFKLYINKISMKNWNSYSPKEKVKLMQIFIRNGITDLNQMQEYINSFDTNPKKDLNKVDEAIQTLNQQDSYSSINRPTPTTYNTGGKKQSVEMTPSEAEALNKKLDTSQYMLAVGNSPEDPAYLSPGYLEPATVKAFDSQEDYNRHIGDKFGEYVSNSISNAGTKLAPVLAGTAAFPFALNLGMAAYANPFVRTALDVVGTIDGVRNFVSDNGVSKTIRLAKEGDTWGAVKSGVGDIFDIASIGDLYTVGKPLFHKAKKKFGEKVFGMVEDMNGYVKEGSHFRIVDKPAIDDAITSGVIRAKTGLYHGTPEYLKANFFKYLDDIPNWENMDAVNLRDLLESKGAFDDLSANAKKVAKIRIRNSTNQGGTVHYFRNTPYPAYEIKPSNYVIETPESVGSFVAGQKGREYTNVPLEKAEITLLKTNGSVKGASLPTKGSSYWKYSPFWEMWKSHNFATGGRLLDGNEEEQTLSGKGYIQTNQADLSDVETFNRNWYKYRDTQLANAIKDNYDAKYTEGLNFLQKGFPNWTDQTKVANAARNYINKKLDTVTEFDSREALKDLKTRSWLEDEYYNIFPNKKPNIELIGPPKPVSDSDLKFIIEFLYNGVYNPKTHSIVYNKGLEKSSTKVHERAHASVPMIKGVSRSPLLAPILKVQLMDTVKADPTYYDAVDEIYARLMQLRFANNLDPTHTYTLDEVKAMRNDSKFKDYGIFNRYTDESILLLLNEVAQNTTDSTKLNYVNPDNIAAYGGKLNTLENGGDKDNSYIPNIFLDPLSLVSFNKSNDNKLGVPYRDFNSSDYSYYDANKGNMPTEKGGHWTSRNNETGQILKSPDHPTFINELIEGLKKGYVPTENPIDDLFYSIPKINSYPDIPMRNLNERYNIFEDDKANNSKKAHRESLDNFIKNNPTLYGLNTADFADFFSQLAGLEGSYKKDAGKGMMYSGYYGLKDGSDDTEDEQHKRAFKHLAGLFQNSIVKEDILKGLSLGYSPAQILAKYWNQGNRVTQFLWNGVDDKDGKGSKISEYGWNMTADIDYLKYLKDAITDDEVKVKDAKSLNEAIVRVRKPNINYSNREADILKFNTARNKKFDTKKLRVGDTIYLTPPQEK